MNGLNDLTRNSELSTNGRYLVKSQAKEAALLASSQVWEGGFTIVVDYDNVKYVKITDGEKTFTNIEKTGEGGGGGSTSDADITFTDITTGNVSTTKHGFAPKAPNVATQFLNGLGEWSAAIVKAIGSPVDIQYGWAGTQAEYDLLTPDSNTVYIITDALDVYATISASSGTGTALTFTEDKVYGTIASPETGNITASATGAKLGVTTLIIHNSGTEPTFDAKFAKLSGSGDYVISVLNYISCQYINSTKILYSINQEA